ncbi:hypothetical protein ACU635_03955 [[Actinomadura] parvosata]|uniref:hypothetical protein n=1 Tax=[Actinomadura] parvosata TaxID=1955412 RepID=UPI00406CB945
MEPTEKTDYENAAGQALQQGDVAAAQVWATLHQAEVLRQGLAKLEEAVHALAMRP